jgi:hypothetical protein
MHSGVWEDDMAQLILRIQPPTAGAAQYLLQELSLAVASLGEGGKAAMDGLRPTVNQVGGRDAIIVLTAKEGVSADQVRAVGQVAALFQGRFAVNAEIDGQPVGDAPRAAAPPEPPATAFDLGHDPDDTAPAIDADEPTLDEPDEDEVPPYSEWSKAELVEECEARGLPKSGNKDVLVERLEANDAEGDEE